MAVTVDNTKGAYTIPALSGSGYVPIGGGTMTGALTIASGTLAASQPAVNITQTWNQGATAFTGALINITNTASSGSSRAIDVQIAGTSIFAIRPDGYAIASAGLFVGSGGTNGLWDPAGPRVKSTGYFSWAQSANATDTADLMLYRDAAATLAQRNGTTAQTLRIYGTYTSASVYERLSLTCGSANVDLSAESLGASANMNIRLYPKGTGGVYIGSGTVNLANAILMNSANGYYDGSVTRLTSWQQFTETTAPSAGAADTVRIYAEDNGSGKTRLMALFSSGAAQQIAIQP